MTHSRTGVGKVGWMLVHGILAIPGFYHFYHFYHRLRGRVGGVDACAWHSGNPWVLSFLSFLSSTQGPADGQMIKMINPGECQNGLKA